jgi:hypothetical protein
MANNLSGLIIPMKVLVYRVKSDQDNVIALNPNSYTSTLIKNPTPFNKNIHLPPGIHLHFILPSTFRHGEAVSDKYGHKSIKYPHVPDKFIVTRILDKDGKQEIDCNIVDSAFISKSMNEQNSNSITFPFFDKESNKLSYRYLGRQYSGIKNISAQKQSEEKDDHLDKHELFAVGPGDPMFNAYYPSCRSVFGYYDKLEHVPSDAVLTYSVIGYYSNSDNDPFNKVDSAETMNDVLKKFGLSVDDKNYICNSCLLFGEVCNIDINHSFTTSNGNIDIGIGRTSAEALSAMISKTTSPQNNIEHILTMLQYDLADEKFQLDGNFKIDDSIHSHGFTSIDPIETKLEVIFNKDYEVTQDILSILSKDFPSLCEMQHSLGKSKRLLEYKKKSLYYLWELYIRNKDDYPSEILNNIIYETVNEIKGIRDDNIKAINNIASIKKELENKLPKDKIKIEETSAAPFYYPKDPTLILFGDGINRTYVFEEEEKGKTLNCLTEPLTNEKAAIIKETFSNYSFIDEINKEKYFDYLVMTEIIKEETNETQNKYPDMVNSNPYEQTILFMSWDTSFHYDYIDSNPSGSSFIYSNTDYTYNEEEHNENNRDCQGTSVLTPHGISNLGDKLENYINKNPDDPDCKIIKEKLNDIIKKIKQSPVISQNLGGFTINLPGLEYTFQKPIEYESDDNISAEVYKCLYTDRKDYEDDKERLAISQGKKLVPLREGFLNLDKISIVTTFGNEIQPKNSSNQTKYKYISENLCANSENSDENKKCFLPLALTTPARITSYFVSASNKSIPSNSLPESTPIIAIIMPDMLNQNLDIFDNKGELIGILKTKYEDFDGKKFAVGSFMQAPSYSGDIENTPIDKFINLFKEKKYYFAELMDVIKQKLDNTIPMNQGDHIFGRTLVLAEMNIELEYFGGTEFSKESISNIEKKNLDDKGLSEQAFPVMIGDINRVTDGVICGFYGGEDGFDKGFTAFGYKTENNIFLKHNIFLKQDNQPTISGKTSAKVTLLLDPSLKVTLSTGILPVEQIQINAIHTNFSKMNLQLAEMNTLISDDKKILLPNFSKNAKFIRQYPQKSQDTNNNDISYTSLEIINDDSKIGTIEKTIITDGFIAKSNKRK